MDDSRMDLRQELIKLKDEKGLSQNALSRALGVSTAAVSQYLSGEYKGNLDIFEKKVKSLIEKEVERSSRKKLEIPTVNTQNLKKFWEVATICHLDSELGVVYGESGLGKTRACRAYADRFPDVILIEADLGYTAVDVFSELSQKCGLDGGGTIRKMFEAIIGKLKNSGRLIILDEAEHLPYRATELIRRIHDKAEVGILLVGMPRLLANLRGKQGEYTQLYNRIALAGGLENLNGKDIDLIVEAVLPQSSGRGDIFYKYSEGNIRVLSMLMKGSKRIAELNQLEINEDVIKRAYDLLITKGGI